MMQSKIYFGGLKKDVTWNALGNLLKYLGHSQANWTPFTILWGTSIPDDGRKEKKNFP